MTFDPKPGLDLEIEETIYRVAEHPAAAGIPYGQEGRAAIVYKLDGPRGPRALKVFKARFRTPDLVLLAEKLAPHASIPGLAVCRRSVLTPQQHNRLLRQYPDLTYSVLMPWIEGPTWLQILQEKTPLSPQQSLTISQAFAHILSEMEQQGLAHCDLSAANLILPLFLPNQETAPYASVELVDVEQFFARNLDQPEAVPSGSDGYAHSTIRQAKIWNAKVDRFSGAVLLAEMLGWANPSIREAAWGESYFDPREIQRPSRRFDLLHPTIAKDWGAGVAELLERAWRSEILSDCPTFGEWLVALPEAAPQVGQIEQEPALSSSSMVQSNDRTITTLLGFAEQLTAQGNRSGALEAYRKALSLTPPGSPESRAIQTLLQSLEAILPAQQAVSFTEQSKEPGPEKQSSCPYCEKSIPSGSNACPLCGKTIGQATELEGKQPAKKPSHRVRTLGLAIILLVVLGVILTAFQPPKTPGGDPLPTPTTAVAVSEIDEVSTATTAPSITPTAVFTATQRPTSTTRPTEAPTPTVVPPDFLNAYLTGVKITRLGTFDGKESDMVFNDQNTRVQNGQLYLVGRGYSGGVEKVNLYQEGQGVLFDFKLSKEQPSPAFEFEAFFQNGAWYTDGYRRFGVYITISPQANLFMGKTGTGNYLVGNLNLKTDTWYRLVMAIGKGGDFLSVIWDPDDPTKTRYFHQPMGKNWANLPWKFIINGALGNMEVDNLMNITFDGFVK